MEVIPIEVGAGQRPDPERLYRELEQGHILMLTQTPFAPSEEDAAFLRAQRRTAGNAHKNIAFKPSQQKLTGVQASGQEDAARLKSILAAYSEGALAFLKNLLPDYAKSWRVDYASFRSEEEEGRDLPMRHRNDLMHVDAFPTRPTHGDRILRAFTNLHATRDRVWAVADPFEDLAARYAAEAGLDRVTGPLADIRRASARVSRLVGVRMPDRSPYDEFMLGFHHYLKENVAFQSSGCRATLAFPPGATWISFTDQIAHAVRSGQYALEQTCIVPFAALKQPDRAPLRVLERLAGRPLSAPHSPAAEPVNA
jgi:hypothetical protein